MEEINTPLAQPTTGVATPPPTVESPQPPKKKNPLKIILPILLVVLVLFVAYYLIFYLRVIDMIKIFNNSVQDDQETSQEVNEQGDDSAEEEDVEEEYPFFEGEYISVILPDDWSIEEYYDGEGTDMLTGGITFTGLTGLKIFRDTTEVFYMQAAYGIGFAGCPPYARFEDENPDYYAQIVEDNQVSGDTAVVTDYTDTEYVEFEWLGKTFRRIDDYYNYDTVDGNEFFEPSCVPSLVTLEGLEFLPEDGPAATAYDYGLTSDATQEDWLVVDEILDDMILTN